MNQSETFAFAHGGPAGRGILRASPENFVVDEVLGFEPESEGEHVWLHLRKRGENTAWVARRIAALAGLPEREIGYSGLKDRHALTSQWFSVPVAPAREPDWTRLEDEGLSLLAVTRHGRKLRRGTHQANRFEIVVRGVECDETLLADRLDAVTRLGVPNYFGEQRFGRAGGNLDKVLAMFARRYRPKGRSESSLLLSSARSWLFNHVLDARVADGSWNRLMPGEVAMLDGTHSVFSVEDASDQALVARCEAFDIHPTGPLWGQGEPMSTGECRALEMTQAQQRHAQLAEGLAAAGLRQERRSLRLLAGGFSARHVPGEDGMCLHLSFALPAGTFATVVLREILATTEARQAGQPDRNS
jgi:tRNA pseudouridine13 synthase